VVAKGVPRELEALGRECHVALAVGERLRKQRALHLVDLEMEVDGARGVPRGFSDGRTVEPIHRLVVAAQLEQEPRRDVLHEDAAVVLEQEDSLDHVLELADIAR